MAIFSEEYVTMVGYTTSDDVAYSIQISEVCRSGSRLHLLEPNSGP